MNTVFLPLLIQLGMTLTILLFLPRMRVKEIKANPSLLKKARTGTNIYSEKCQQISNSFNNQLQLPIIFYVGCIFAILFGATGLWAGIFAWCFVCLRIAHASVHLTYNNVRHRFLLFAAGIPFLIGFWIIVIAAAQKSPLLSDAIPLSGLGG